MKGADHMHSEWYRSRRRGWLAIMGQRQLERERERRRRRRDLLLLLACHQSHQQRQEQQRQQYLAVLALAEEAQKQLVTVLELAEEAEDNRPARKRNTVPRAAIVKPADSPLQHIVLIGGDPAFILTMGVNRAMFDALLKRFKPLYNTTPLMPGHGEPSRLHIANRILAPDMALALVLTYMHSLMRAYRLGQLAGVTQSSVTKYLALGQRVLLAVFATERQAQVEWTCDKDTLQGYSDIITRRHPLMEGVACTLDGLALRTLQPEEPAEQAKLYSASKAGYYCSNLLCFAPTGGVLFARLNDRGSQHDSTLARECGLYKLIAGLPPGFMVAADTAFSRSGDLGTKVFRPTRPNEEPEEHPKVEAQLVNLRDTATWGMRGFQSCCPRLLAPLPRESEKRDALLTLAVRIYHMRSHFVTPKQVAEVYRIAEWRESTSVNAGDAESFTLPRYTPSPRKKYAEAWRRVGLDDGIPDLDSAPGVAVAVGHGPQKRVWRRHC